MPASDYTSYCNSECFCFGQSKLNKDVEQGKFVCMFTSEFVSCLNIYLTILKQEGVKLDEKQYFCMPLFWQKLCDDIILWVCH